MERHQLGMRDGQYFVMKDGNAFPISDAQYTRHAQDNALADETGGNLGEQLLLGASKAGQGFSDAAQDLYGRATGNDEMVQGIADRRASDAEVYNRTSPGAGVAFGEGVVQALPYIAAGGAAALPAVGGATMIGQTAAQAGAAGLTGFGTTYGDVEQRAIVGGMDAGMTGAGAFAGAAMQRIGNRLRGRRMDLTVQQRRAGEAMDRGMELSPSQASGSTGFYSKNIEPILEGFGDSAGRNEQLYQTATGRALGMADDAIDLSTAGLGKAADDIGAKFDVLKGTSISLSPEQSARLTELNKLSPYMDFPSNTNTLDGNTYKRIRRQLSQMATNAAKNPQAPVGLADELQRNRKMLDLKFQKAAGPEAAKAFKQAREQWKILETVERGSALNPDGSIRKSSMASAVNQMWGKTNKRGKYAGVAPETQAWLQQVNDQASTFAQPAVGNSGTAARSGIPAITAGAGMGGAGVAGGLMGMYADDQMDGPLTQNQSGAAGGAAAMSALGLLMGNYGRMGNAAGRSGQAGQLLGPILNQLMKDDE